jgi:hypothetical protein
MSMLYLKVLNEKGKEVDLKSLTSTGLEMIKHDLDEMTEEVDNLMMKKR